MSQSTNSVCSNSFAILLSVYERYKRVMLNGPELSKIARKYSSKPANLLLDLKRKYPYYDIPEAVSLAEVFRIAASHPIPDSYKALMHLPTDICFQYFPEHDGQRTEFDSLKVLTDQFLIANSLDAPPVDNMSKAWSLLPETASARVEAEALAQSRRRAASPLEKKDKSDANAKKDKKLPVLARIALDSCSGQKGGSSGVSLTEAPLSLLHRMMSNREKATVVTREKSRVRGRLHGYIRGFDKHFNLILTDVDEEYIPHVVQLDPAMTVGRSSSSSHHLDASDREASGGCLSKMNIRHLPQVLVRGDNVVSVYRYRSTYYGKKS